MHKESLPDFKTSAHCIIRAPGKFIVCACAAKALRTH